MIKMSGRYSDETEKVMDMLNYLREEKIIGFFADKKSVKMWADKFLRRREDEERDKQIRQSF